MSQPDQRERLDEKRYPAEIVRLFTERYIEVVDARDELGNLQAVRERRAAAIAAQQTIEQTIQPQPEEPKVIINTDRRDLTQGELLAFANQEALSANDYDHDQVDRMAS